MTRKNFGLALGIVISSLYVSYVLASSSKPELDEISKQQLKDIQNWFERKKGSPPGDNTYPLEKDLFLYAHVIENHLVTRMNIKADNINHTWYIPTANVWRTSIKYKLDDALPFIKELVEYFKKANERTEKAKNGKIIFSDYFGMLSKMCLHDDVHYERFPDLYLKGIQIQIDTTSGSAAPGASRTRPRKEAGAVLSKDEAQSKGQPNTASGSAAPGASRTKPRQQDSALKGKKLVLSEDAQRDLPGNLMAALHGLERLNTQFKEAIKQETSLECFYKDWIDRLQLVLQLIIMIDFAINGCNCDHIGHNVFEQYEKIRKEILPVIWDLLLRKIFDKLTPGSDLYFRARILEMTLEEFSDLVDRIISEKKMPTAFSGKILVSSVMPVFLEPSRDIIGGSTKPSSSTDPTLSSLSSYHLPTPQASSVNLAYLLETATETETSDPSADADATTMLPSSPPPSIQSSRAHSLQSPAGGSAQEMQQVERRSSPSTSSQPVSPKTPEGHKKGKKAKDKTK